MKPARYTKTAIAMHWLIVLMLIGAFALGWYMTDLKISPAKLQYYAWHKWLGITILGLVVLRLLWRVTHKPPPLPLATPRWQVLAAGAGHWTLYLLLLAIPLSGWAHSSAAGFPVVYFGWLQLPDWLPKDKALAHQMEELHEMLTTALLVVVAAHVLAALKHHFIDRDGLLHRMWFGRDGSGQ